MDIIDKLVERLFGKKKKAKSQIGVTGEPKIVPKIQKQQPSMQKPQPSRKQISETTRKLIEEIEKAERRDEEKSAVKIKKTVKKKVPKKKAKVRTTEKYKKREMEEAMQEFRKSIKSLGSKIERLEESVQKEKIEPKQALGGVKTIYRELKSEKKNVDAETKQTKQLMQFLERDFLKRKINEEMFRKKMFDYREKLHKLHLEKKELSTQKHDLKETTERIPQVAPVSLEKLSKTVNLEQLLEKQTKSLEILAEESAKRTKIEKRVIKTSTPAETERIETAMRFTTPMKKVDPKTGVETQIKKYKIETDFDKILNYVEVAGSVKIGKIAAEIGISKKRVDECCKLLRNEKQVYIVYPTFGDPIIQTMDYKERAEMEKIKNKKNKEKERKEKENKKKGKRD